MEKSWIKNFDELAVTENRKLALAIANAGLESICTQNVISSSIKLEGDVLNVAGENFDLSKFKKIKVVGFGKASIEAAGALEKILGPKIEAGAVVGLHKTNLNHIETFAGTHPRSSAANVEAGERIYEIVKDSGEEDLIIVLVSGGGSALLCYSKSECEQNVAIYDEFLNGGGTINEINTIRKRISILKGGGLAKIAYPATVIGIIFSDIPDDDFSDVASGPTYKDKSSKDDVERIIKKYNLGKFNLLETPKENKYFKKVHNFVLVSNKTAVEAMEKKGRELGLRVKVVSTELYNEIGGALKKIFGAQGENTVVLGAGEPAIKVLKKGEVGGRNLHLGLQALQMKMLGQNSVFISFASDGLDNSDVAGAIVDENTAEKSGKLGLNVDDYLDRFDSYNFFQKTGDRIITGPTGANVSDLMILLTKK